MNIRIPWLISRRRLIVSFLTDIIMIAIINKYFLSNYLLFVESEYFFNIIFIPFWILFSYVFGKYSYDEEFYRNKNLILVFKLFFKTVLISILSILIVLIISININLNNYNHFDKIILSYCFSLSIFINIFQIPIILSCINIANKAEIWIFYGPKQIFNLLNEELKYSRKKMKILYNLDTLNTKFSPKQNVKGLIIHDIKGLNKSEYNMILKKKNSALKIYDVEKWCEYYLQRLPCDLLTLEYLTNNFSEYTIQMRLKRLGDLFLSSILLVITFPILIIAGLFIFLDDRNGFIYTQERVGKNQKNFILYKLRTMKHNAEKGKPQWSKKFDTRITKVGKFLRKTRLDELPQLINVILGDMSLIGPRPEREIFDVELSTHIPQYNSRYLIRPGLSGWAQVNFPYGSSIEDSKKKFSYDIYYLKNYSIWLDFLILLKTIKIVFLKRGSDPIR